MGTDGYVRPVGACMGVGSSWGSWAGLAAPAGHAVKGGDFVATINHGTVRGYKSGCRCDLCTHANTKAKARERERRRERDGKPPTPRKPPVPTTPKTTPPEDEPGPIEAGFREALNDPTDSALVRARREVVFAAARNMDNPKHAPFFKSHADVIRATVSDLIAATPAKDGEADALKELVESFGPRGRSRGRAAVDDTEAPE